MEEIEVPFTAFKQPERIQQGISQWKIEREMLDMYYEMPRARWALEELAGRLGLRINFKALTEQLLRIEEFEKEKEEKRSV